MHKGAVTTAMQDLVQPWVLRHRRDDEHAWQARHLPANHAKTRSPTVGEGKWSRYVAALALVDDCALDVALVGWRLLPFEHTSDTRRMLSFTAPDSITPHMKDRHMTRHEITGLSRLGRAASTRTVATRFRGAVCTGALCVFAGLQTTVVRHQIVLPGEHIATRASPSHSVQS